MDWARGWEKAQALWRWLLHHRWLAFAIILAGLAVQTFAEIAGELLEGELDYWDQFILNFVALLRTDTLERIAQLLSTIAAWPVVILLVLPFMLYLIATRRWHVAATVFLVLLGTSITIGLLKILFERPRPLHSLIIETGKSFPSGHATGSMVLYGLLGYLTWRYLVHPTWARVLTVLIAALLILGTGVSRLILGVHYPSDVLAGWAAGALILIGSLILLESAPAE